MRFATHFSIERDASRRFGLDLVAVDATGQHVGSARILEHLFVDPGEAAAQLVGALRGAVHNPGLGFSPSQLLFPPSGAAVRPAATSRENMTFRTEFRFEKGSNGKYSIVVAALDAEGQTLGQAEIHDATFDTPHEAAERLVAGFRGAFRQAVPPAFGRDLLFPTPEMAKHW